MDRYKITAKKFFGHLRTITRHRHKVMMHCFKAGIFRQGLRHDLSKYSPVEFMTGARYYQGTRSPNEAERETIGYSAAWIHHKVRNPHHFEYWTDYNLTTRQVEPVPMPKKYVVEMFCDRVAASKIYNGASYTDADSIEYYYREKSRRLHPDTAKDIELLLNMLKDKGEKETFRYIRKVYNKK